MRQFLYNGLGVLVFHHYYCEMLEIYAPVKETDSKESEGHSDVEANRKVMYNTTNEQLSTKPCLAAAFEATEECHVPPKPQSSFP